MAAPEIKKKLIKQLDPLKEAKKASLDAVKEAQTAKSDIQTQGKSVKDSINSSFDEIITIVEQRRQELLTEADEIVTSKCDNLSSQEEKLSTRHARFHSAIDYTEHCVEHAADDEIMCMHAWRAPESYRGADCRASEGREESEACGGSRHGGGGEVCAGVETALSGSSQAYFVMCR